MPNPIAYGIIRKSLSDRSFIDAYHADPDGTLIKEGIQSEDLSDLHTIIKWASLGHDSEIDVGKKLQDEAIQTLAVTNEMKQGLRNTLDQINSALKHTMLMYQISFYIGILLVIVFGQNSDFCCIWFSRSR